MAVVDKYANADLENGKLGAAANVAGNKVVTSVVSFNIESGDAANSVYRVFPNLNPCLIPVDIKVMNTAVTGASDVDLGLYEGEKGNVIDADCLADGLTIATAHAKSAALDGLTSVAVDNIGKQLFELAGHTIANRKDTYDIALTLNGAATADGTVTVIGTFVQG